ncbi:MAG: polysaccharide deacetylase family protein [Candidatus Omnitrophota bacterium]
MYGTVQVDLDGLWTYCRYLGREVSPEKTDPVYTEGLVRFLELFNKYNIKATFFIVGKDAHNPVHRVLIEQIAGQGHEIANHTMTHPERFSCLSENEINKEISLCSDVLQKISGQEPAGFRAPTFGVNEKVLSVLSDRGYTYDSSLVPSGILPLIMDAAHSFWRKRIMSVRAGRLSFGLAPLDIYRPQKKVLWKRGQNRLVEVPVSVIPGLRLPMHSSYVFLFGLKYFEYGLKKMRKANVSMNYLFHGIDLVDLSTQDLRLPGAKPVKDRIILCEQILKKLRLAFDLMTTKKLVTRSEKKI